MPFLLNVIAALPLRSARMLLALRDAGRIEIIAGRAEVASHDEGQTIVEVRTDNGPQSYAYRMFVNCTGQGPVSWDSFPFRSLVQTGTVRPARAKFADGRSVGNVPDKLRDRITQVDDEILYKLGGIDVDSNYRVVVADGTSHQRIYDLAFPHIAGVRPYSYGLQACELTAKKVVESWKAVERIRSHEMASSTSQASVRK